MGDLLEIAKAAGVEGFLHCNEFQKLIELAAGKDVLEVGSFKGLSAYGMAWTAKSITCVDTFRAATDGQRQTEAFTTLENFERATRRFNNVSLVIASSEEAARIVTGDFDLIFLDAMHDYENVKADIGRWWSRVRQGGIIAFHDYGHADWPDVKRAVDEMFGAPSGETVVVTLRWVCRNVPA